MDKSYFLPIGYMVDTDNIIYHVDSKHYHIISLVVFDLEKAELVPMKMEEVPSNNAFRYRFSNVRNNDFIFEIIEFVIESNPLRKYTIHCGSAYFNIWYDYCLPIYSKDMELIKTFGGSFGSIQIDRHLSLDITFNPVFDYKVCVRHIKSVTLCALSQEIPHLADFLPIFNKLSDGIYENNGVVVITDDFKGKSLIIPDKAKCIWITAYKTEIYEIVFNSMFKSLYTTGSLLMRTVRKIYISKDTSKRQLSQIIENIRIRRLIVSDTLAKLFCAEEFDSYYAYLLDYNDLAKKILVGIEVVVY